MNEQETAELEALKHQLIDASDNILAMVSICEDSRQFMAVARLALEKNNPELAADILTTMIARLDPLFQNTYDKIKDEDLVDSVKIKMENPPDWYQGIIPDEEVEESNDQTEHE